MKRILALSLALVLFAFTLLSCSLFGGSKPDICGKSFAYSSFSANYGELTGDEFFALFADDETEQIFVDDLVDRLTRETGGRVRFSDQPGADNCTLDGKKVNAYALNYQASDEYHATVMCYYIEVEGAKNEYLLYDVDPKTDYYTYTPYSLVAGSNHGSSNRNGNIITRNITLTADAVKIVYDPTSGKLTMDLSLVVNREITGEETVHKTATMQLIFAE